MVLGDPSHRPNPVQENELADMARPRPSSVRSVLIDGGGSGGGFREKVQSVQSSDALKWRH